MPIAWVTRVQRAGQSVAVMVPGEYVGLWYTVCGTLGQARTSSSAAAKGAVTKDSVQEDCLGIEQREPAPALLGMAVSPNPVLQACAKRGYQDDFQETIPLPHPETFHACSHSATFPGQRGVPSIWALQQSHCPWRLL